VQQRLQAWSPAASRLAPDDPEEKFDRKAAAVYIGCSFRTLENWGTRGGGPRFLKIGSRVVYRRRDLDAWLRACERTSTSDRGPA
jgi:hypothetical protein